MTSAASIRSTCANTVGDLATLKGSSLRQVEAMVDKTEGATYRCPEDAWIV